MSTDELPALDQFPGGFLVTDANRNILYANHYFKTRFHFDPVSLHGRNLLDLLTRASAIMCESYVLPLLLHERQCEEIHLVILDSAGNEVPVIVNAAWADEDKLYWTVYSSIRRDCLYQDLVEARRSLEEKAGKLQVLSSTDELTGLFNRRELLRQSQRIIAAAKRNQQPVSVLIFDIDRFKRINDRWGHAAGDAVLKDFGRLLKRYGRETDIIARFGGDEFVCLLPDTNLDAAKGFANRVHKLVRQVANEDFEITVSIGLAAETTDIDFERLFQKADKALYRAKATGRNRSKVAPSDAIDS